MPPFFYFEPQTGVTKYKPIRSNFYVFRLHTGNMSHIKAALSNAMLRDEGLVYPKEFLVWLHKNDTKWDQWTGLPAPLETDDAEQIQS